MSTGKFELSEELLQRYYDGELDESSARAVEQALAEDGAAASTLADYRAVGRMLRAASEQSLPDELSAQRTWDAISKRTGRDANRHRIRKPASWLAAAVAAAAIVLYISPFNIVPQAQASNELEIESIDCNYASFMLLQPEGENGHTIIWINDSVDSQ